MTTGTTRGLAATLRSWDDDRLATLLLARPDLARPVPHGVEALAARATSPASVTALLPELSRGDIQAAQAVLGGAAPTGRLLGLALVWDEGGWVLAAPLAAEVDGRDLGDPRPEPPVVELGRTSDDAAGLAAAQAVSLTDEALWRIARNPPRVLRTGGVPAADVRLLARALDVDEATCVLVLHVANAARLLAETDDDEPVWAPSVEYDEWTLLPAAERWTALALAWLDLRAAPHLVGSPRQGKGTTNALAPETVWAPMRLLRRHVVEELATLDGGPGAADLAARVQWRHAFVHVTDHVALVEAVLAEASWLGVVAGGLSAAGRALLSGLPSEAAAAVAPLLPAPAERVLVGADLTAVVPGLVEGDLARLLRSVADVESRGGATVYRFTAASLERALDDGWSVADIRTRLGSVGELPQALGYLLDDAARRHAALAVGGVSSYLRCDDPLTLADLAAQPRLALRTVAPTVAVSTLAPTVLLARLRAAGRVPAVEGPDGEVHVVGGTPVRSAARRRPVGLAPLDHDAAREAVAAVRSGARVDVTDTREPELIRALLTEAAARSATVRVDYVGAGDTPVVVDLVPSRVEPGRVRGVVDGAERVIPLPRVSRVRA